MEDHSPAPAAENGTPYLPTGVARNARNNETVARRTSCTHCTLGFVRVSARPAFFCEFDHDALETSVFYDQVAVMRRSLLGTHKALAVEVMDSVFSVPGAFELDETKASHDTAVDNTAIAIEELLDVLRARIWGQPCMSVSLVTNSTENKAYCRDRVVVPYC